MPSTRLSSHPGGNQGPDGALRLLRGIVDELSTSKVLGFLLTLPLLFAGIGDPHRTLYITLAGFVPVQVLVLAMTTSEVVIPTLIAKRSIFNLLWLALAGLLFAFSLLQGGYDERTFLHWSGSTEFVEPLVRFALLGGVLGVMFRHACGRLAWATLMGRSGLEPMLSTVYVWVVAVSLLPTSGSDAAIGPYYVLTLALGVLMHRANRLRFRNRAHAKRRVENLGAAFADKSELTERESCALKLLAKGKHGPLLEKLSAWDADVKVNGEELPERLRLIRCSALRLNGNYAESIQYAQPNRANSSARTPAEVHLKIITALNLYNLDRETDAQRVIGELLESPLGQNCVVVNATAAISDAYSTLKRMDTFLPDSRPLDLVNQASRIRAGNQRNGKAGASVASSLTEVGMPFTSSFLKDAVGCCLLAAGMIEESRIYFESCIQTDPEYSGSYLNLGTFFLLAPRWSRFEPQSGLSANWHARVCLRTAELLEGERRSSIRRMAKARLAEVSAV